MTKSDKQETITKFRLVLCWAILATVACIALVIQISNDQASLDKSTRAVKQSTMAIKQAEKANRQSASAAQVAAVTSRLAQEIEQERHDSCMTSAARHKAVFNTIRSLERKTSGVNEITVILRDAGVHVQNPTALSRFENQMAKQSYQSTLLLISALAPAVNCKTVAPPTATTTTTPTS